MAEVRPEHFESKLFALFRKEFELCNVREGERAGVIYDSATRPDYIPIAMGALASLGAETFSVHLPGVESKNLDIPGGVTKQTFVGQEKGVVAAASTGKGDRYAANTRTTGVLAALGPAVDIMVDLVRLQHSPGRVDVLNAGGRYISITERPDALARMFPTQDLKKETIAAGQVIDEGKHFEVTSDAGTNLTADMSESESIIEYGFAEDPGRYDVWPGGFVGAFPAAGSTNGTIVLAPGDIVSGFNRYVESKITFTIKDGMIIDIAGDGFDADLMRSYLESWDDEQSFATSHLGWGVNERAKWHAIQFYDKDSTNMQDGRAFAGNFMWSTGPTPGVKRFVPGHFDIPMKNCTVKVDGKSVVENGNLVRLTTK